MARPGLGILVLFGAATLAPGCCDYATVRNDSDSPVEVYLWAPTGRGDVFPETDEFAADIAPGHVWHSAWSDRLRPARTAAPPLTSGFRVRPLSGGDPAGPSWLVEVSGPPPWQVRVTGRAAALTFQSMAPGASQWTTMNVTVTEEPPAPGTAPGT